MSVNQERYDRNVRLFGELGQEKLRQKRAVLLGGGGLGSAVAYQLALLGVGTIVPIDDDTLDDTSRNRFFGARTTDPVGTPKVQLIERLVKETNPDVVCVPLAVNLVSEEAFAAVREPGWVFGCFDDDGPRMILTELCAAYARPYIDLASDVPEPGVYGGRVVVSTGESCLHCLDVLDPISVRQYLQTASDREVEHRIYGIPKEALAGPGPSVAPLNMVVAGLAAMEFMAAVTGLRPPTRHQEYRGHQSKVAVRIGSPAPDCPFCKGSWGLGEAADVERYLRSPHLRNKRRG
jgi:molybdopterin/thiamine biosynthesis adenylyltransferase